MSDNSDDLIRRVLTQCETVVIVGASMNPARPSHYVGQYLAKLGKRVIGVNPGIAGQQLYGETVFGSLSDIPKEIQIDMVDIFRRTEQVPAIVDQALEALPGLKAIWMQLGISHAEAAAQAQARGVDVIQNRCPMIEYPRLVGV